MKFVKGSFTLALSLASASAFADDSLLDAPVGGAEGVEARIQGSTLNCLDGDAVTTRATEELAKFRAKGEDFPDLLSLNTRIATTSKGDDSSIQMFAEAFMRPRPFFYNVIPGIELGLQFDENSLVYVCLDTLKPEADRSLSMYFMSSGALDQGFWSKFHSKQVVFSRENVRSRTTSGFVELFYQIPLFHPLIHLINDVLIRPGEDLVESVMGAVDQWGIERVVIKPHGFTINSAHNSGLGVIPWGFEHTYSYESTWMLDNPPKSPTTAPTQ